MCQFMTDHVLIFLETPIEPIVTNQNVQMENDTKHEFYREKKTHYQSPCAFDAPCLFTLNFMS